MAQSQVERLVLDPHVTGRLGADGIAVAVHGNRVVCSSWGRFDPASLGQYGVSPGWAFVFDGTTGQQLLELTPSNAQPRDHFGASLDMDAQRVLVGAFAGDGQVQDTGAAYLFDLASGQELLRLEATDGKRGDFFGHAVALSGDRAVVGAGSIGYPQSAGAAYLFDLTTGQQVAKLMPPSPYNGVEFGSAVDIEGGFVLVGANEQDAQGRSVHVYDRNGQWLRVLRPATPSPAWEHFGASVLLVGSTAVVGAPESPYVLNGDERGSVYLFDVQTGQQLGNLLPEPEVPASNFGLTLAGGDDRVIVGTPFAENIWDHGGLASVYQLSTRSFLYHLKPASAVPQYGFGHGLAYEGGQMVVGSPWGNTQAYASGGVFVFEDSVPNTGAGFCFGDGTGGACPCGVPGGAWEGCAHGGVAGAGARLDGVGSAALGASTLALHAYGLPPGTPGVFFQGSVQQGPTAFGEGLLCSDISLRLGAVMSSQWGVASMTELEATASSGSLATYQYWYRDSVSSCGQANFNLTNAWRVTW